MVQKSLFAVHLLCYNTPQAVADYSRCWTLFFETLALVYLLLLFILRQALGSDRFIVVSYLNYLPTPCLHSAAERRESYSDFPKKCALVRGSLSGAFIE